MRLTHLIYAPHAFSALMGVRTVLVAFTGIGIPPAFLLVAVLGLWVLYRIWRGWLALNDGRPVAV